MHFHGKCNAQMQYFGFCNILSDLSNINKINRLNNFRLNPCNLPDIYQVSHLKPHLKVAQIRSDLIICVFAVYTHKTRL